MGVFTVTNAKSVDLIETYWDVKTGVICAQSGGV